MDKDEITKMPQGMSSEELDALTTGEEIEQPEVSAQEVATEETPPAEESVETEAEKVAKEAIEEKPPVEEKPEEPEAELSEVEKQLIAKDSVIGGMRRKNRDLELKFAKIEGELEARKSIQVEAKAPEKSPLELAEADYFEQNSSMTGFAMDGGLYRKQKAFDDKQAAEKAAAAQSEQATTVTGRTAEKLQADDFSVEKVGEGLDFNTVVGIGQHYLDKADLMKIQIVNDRDGNEVALRKTYELCKEAILAANNTDSQLLKIAISKSQTKPKTEKPDIDALTTKGEDENKGEAEKGTQDNRLYEFVTSP